jgi:hypothetical protein
VIANILLAWYVISLLKKFIFISQNMADLFLTTKAFQVFIKSLHSMDTYRGEPMIQELIMRIQEVSEEIEIFREVFEYSLDEEMEEELRAVEEETQEVY